MTDIMTANTKDLIQEAVAQKASSPAAPKSDRLKNLICQAQVRDMFRNALQEHADSFLASVVDLYTNDRCLQSCSASEVLMEAFKAATLKLPINKQLGFAYIVPFRDNRQNGKLIPTFQLGYKGYIQLCLRTGAYRHIHAGPVYEGELIGENRLTGEVDLSGPRLSDKVIGFSCYLETTNGFSKSQYWSTERMLAHAKRYSKSYGSSGSPWTTNFDEMATKTILRNLLSRFGILSIELQAGYLADISSAADDEIRNAPPDVENAVPVEEPTAMVN